MPSSHTTSFVGSGPSAIASTIYTMCNGGDNVDPYEYVINEQGGLWNTEADYPYMAIDQDCKFDKEKGVCPVKSWFRPTTTENEDEFAEGLAASGVVAIAIDASCVSF